VLQHIHTAKFSHTSHACSTEMLCAHLAPVAEANCVFTYTRKYVHQSASDVLQLLMCYDQCTCYHIVDICGQIVRSIIHMDRTYPFTLGRATCQNCSMHPFGCHVILTCIHGVHMNINDVRHYVSQHHLHIILTIVHTMIQVYVLTSQNSDIRSLPT